MGRLLKVCWSATFANAELSAEKTVSDAAEVGAVKAPDASVDKTALFRIGYGLYVITVNDGNKDTGCIVNSVGQIADNPLRVSVCINKANYTNEIVNKTGILNVNCLSEETPFEVFKHFGFQSGRTVDKFSDCSDTAPRAANGLIYLSKHINAFMSLKVIRTIDLGSHDMFICEVTEAKALSDINTMSYTYYRQNVKPKPQSKKMGWVCTVCGYIHKGEDLPEDFICPTCKHGAEVFEKLK